MKKQTILSKNIPAKEVILVACGLLGLIIFFFWEAASGKNLWITGDRTTSDLMNQYYSCRHFLAQSLKAGFIPQWTSDILNGFPLLAEIQTGIFYPPNLLLFWLLPTPLAYNWLVILSLFIAGLSTYYYARLLNISILSAALSAVSFTFSAFFIMHIRHMTIINTACYLPTLFLLIELFFRKEQFRYIIITGIIFGLQILAGFPQVAYYSILSASAYFVVKAGYLLYQKLNTPIKKDKTKRLKKERQRLSNPLLIFALRWTIIYKLLGALIIIYLIGVGLSAIQILPAYELAQNSERAGGTTFDYATLWAYHPKNLINFILPYFWGDVANGTYQDVTTQLFWENAAYVGLLPFILAILAAIALFKTRSKVRFFAILFFISLLLVLSKYTPVFKFIWEFIPGFKFFRFPHRFILLCEFSLAILAAFGLDWTVSIFKKMQWQTLIKVLVMLITIVDLFIFGRGHNPVVSVNTWFKEPQVVKFLKSKISREQFFRIYSMESDASFYNYAYLPAKGWKGNLTPYLNHREVLQPDLNMLWDIPSANGYLSFLLRRLIILHVNMLGKDIHICEDGHVAIPPHGARILGLQSVRYVLSFWDIYDPHFKEVFRVNFESGVPPVKVYENSEFLPHILIVPEAKICHSEAEVLDTLISDTFDPLKQVVIENIVDMGKMQGDTSGSTATIKKYSPYEVIISAEMKNTGFLVLNDTYYPGWSLYVDNKPQEILQANFLMRATKLDKGEHIVRFVYKSRMVMYGTIIMGITILFVIGLFIREWRRNTPPTPSF